MALMDFRIVADGVRRRDSWRNSAQDFDVLLEERVDHLDHLPSDASDDFAPATRGPPPLVECAFAWYQAGIQAGPGVLLLDRLHHDKEEHLPHLATAMRSEAHAVA